MKRSLIIFFELILFLHFVPFNFSVAFATDYSDIPICQVNQNDDTVIDATDCSSIEADLGQSNSDPYNTDFSRRDVNKDNVVNAVDLAYCQYYLGQTISYSIDYQLAFPGAVGFGAIATGGRGGFVCQVTNLNDSGEGSLRSCVEMEGTRTVIFRVGGTIHLESDLTISHPNITIAGQTAPGSGIAITGYNLMIESSNVIIRYLRSRPGLTTTNRWPFYVLRTHTVILDHVSGSWSSKDGKLLSIWASQNVTVQNSLFSEAPLGGVDGHTSRGFSLGVGNNNISLFQNILADSYQRNPAIGSGYVDFINNLVYNGMSQLDINQSTAESLASQVPSDLTYESYPKVNILNNYYKFGPTTPATTSGQCFSVKAVDDSDAEDSRYYARNNLSGVRQTLSESEDNLFNPTETGWINTKSDYRFSCNQVYDIKEATILPNYLAENSGANYPQLDSQDQKIINQILSGRSFLGTEGSIVSSQAEAGEVPTLSSGTPPVDSDSDGMSDIWESQHGLDLSSATDRNETSSYDGYTNLELYLHCIIHSSNTECRTTNSAAALVSATTTINNSAAATNTLNGLFPSVLNPTVRLIQTPPGLTPMLNQQKHIRTLEITGTAPAQSFIKITLIGQNGKRIPDSTITQDDGIWIWQPTANLPPGEYTANFLVQDKKGRVGETSLTFTIEENGKIKTTQPILQESSANKLLSSIKNKLLTPLLKFLNFYVQEN